MIRTLLFRSYSEESEMAKNVLDNSKVSYGEIYSDSHSIPLLIVFGNAFSYEGFSNIKKYAETKHSKHGR